MSLRIYLVVDVLFDLLRGPISAEEQNGSLGTIVAGDASGENKNSSKIPSNRQGVCLSQTGLGLG